jgi:glycosyltransferase involved in cell wall biosynthesis
MASKLEIILTSWNELPYVKEVLPRYLKVADRLIMVDDFSTDGTKEWVESLKDPRIDFYQRKFDTCPLQYQSALEHCSKNDTWIWACNPDEIPTDYWFANVRRLLEEGDELGVDRIWATVYHMRGLHEMSCEIGQEIRFFRNDEKYQVRYVGDPHERIDGRFKGNCSPNICEKFATIHFKQADKNKLEIWKHDYVEKLVYSAKDINRRLKYNTIPLPMGITYHISEELRNYLCSQ